jgi:hypothetical protein
MPLLLNVLQHGNGAEHGKLRQKAMECAGLIGLLVTPCHSYVLIFVAA